MEFTFSTKALDLQERVRDFVEERCIPAEPVYEAQRREIGQWDTPAVMEDLKAEARARGLWNLFLPGKAGAGLTNLEYAPLAEISGRIPWIAPEAMNCSAPDTGNMEILAHFASDAVREKWLTPLLAGTVRSVYSMTEPDVASSDANNISCQITEDGDGFRINGRKWWSSGASEPALQDCDRHGLVRRGRRPAPSSYDAGRPARDFGCERPWVNERVRV